MLNMIKSMIQEHQEQVMTESSDLFIENSGGLQMNPETLILGEGTDDVQPDFNGIDDSDSAKDDAGDNIAEGNEPDDGDNNPYDDHEPDDDDKPGEENPEDEPKKNPEEADDTTDDGEGNPVLPDDGEFEGDSNNDSLMNSSIEDDLPTPMGAQTGEPINQDNDLLSTEIDLTSNTMRDTMPTPPKGASDAVVGDDDDHSMGSDNGGPSATIDTESDEVKDNPILAQLANMINNADGDSIRVDQLKELFHESVSTTGNIEDEIMVEAMTIGDPAPDGQNAANGSTDPNAGDTASTPAANSAAPDASETDGGDQLPDDNTVTAAVKDKVAESEEPIEAEPDAGATSNNGEGGTQVKDNLLKKLANLSKSIEDTKKEIIDSL